MNASPPPAPLLPTLKTRVAHLTARADRYFMTDEDLPLSRHLLMISIAAFVFLFIVWASFARLDEMTRGEGRVIPSSEIQAIQNLEGGIVDDFLVKEGDAVKAGQVLLRLRNLDAASGLGSNQARYLGLLATVTRLQAEAEGKDSVEFSADVTKGAPQSVTEELNTFTANRTQLTSQLTVLDQQLTQRRQEVSELTTKSRDLAGVIQLSVKEKEMIAPLVAKGSAPKIELVQLERDILERQAELNSVRQAIPRGQTAIAEAEARIEEMKKTARAKAQADLSARLADMNALKETLLALEDRKARTEIRSPVDGLVKDLKVNTVGGVIKPGDTMMEIVPVNDQLVIEARIRPADIAFIHPAQKAVVKITAYDYAIYGGLNGEVVDISADTIMNEKGESFYHVKVRTFEAALRRRDEILPIIPGMVANVEILTGHKTVMEYLLKPFIKTIDQAMHER